MTAIASSPFRTSFSIDWILFTGAFLLGAGAIVTLKEAGLAQGWVTAVPVLVLIGYVMLVTMVPAARIRLDQAADNAYYLGFLYTLTSLGMALIRFEAGGVGVDAVISNFGIALLTTIVGVMLRVVIQQMRQDPADIEQESRESLALASSRLRAELDSVVRDMNSFRRATQQSISEGFDEIREGVETLLRDSTARYSGVTDEALREIGAAAKRFAKAADRLDASSRSTIEALTGLVDRVDAIKPPADLVERLVEPAGDAMDSLTSLYEQRARKDLETSQAMASVAESVTRAASVIDRHVSAVAGQAESVERSLEAVGRLMERTNSIEEAMAQVDQAASTLLMQRERMAAVERQVAEDHAEGLRKVSEQLPRHLGDLRSVIEQQSRIASEEAAGLLRNASRNQAELATALSTQLDGALRSLRSHNDGIEEELRRSRAATEAVISQLTGLAQLLGDRLGGPAARTP